MSTAPPTANPRCAWNHCHQAAVRWNPVFGPVCWRHEQLARLASRKGNRLLKNMPAISK